MQMELADLKIFTVLAEEGSATKAAIRLAMTQPGVSQHIAKLEKELQASLFDRVGKKLELNEFGRKFLDGAIKLLAQADELRNVEQYASCPVGNLKLGLTDSSTLTVIPNALAKFRKLYAGVHIRLDVDDSGDIEHGVLRGHYDFGVVTAGSKRNPLLDEDVLYCDRIDAIVSKSHPLAKRKRISLKTLAEWPLLVYPRRSRTRNLIDEKFHAENLYPKDVIDVYTNSAAIKLAEVEVGVALLSREFIVNEMQRHKFAHLRIEGDPLVREICLAIKKSAHLSEAAHEFLKILRECLPAEEK